MPGATKGQIRKQLARYVREQTGDGSEAIDLMVAIMQGKAPGLPKNAIRLRMEAAEWLIDRGWGKAPQEIAIEASYADDQEELEDWDLEKLEAAIRVTAVAVIPDTLSKDG